MPNPLHAYIKYVVSKYFLLITFLNESLHIHFCTQLNSFTVKYKTALFQTIQFSISTVFCLHSRLFKWFFVYTQLNVKTALFQTIQFSISAVFCLHSHLFKCFFVHTQLNVKTALFQTIQFSISTVFCLHSYSFV